MGGCVAVNRPLDMAGAEFLAENFVEVVVAPSFEEGTVELLASNNTVNADDNGGYDDWVELYNPGDRPIYLDDYTMTSNLDDPGACPLVDGLEVPAEGWLLLWADAVPDEGDTHLCFSLSRAGGEVGLYTPSGALMDAVVFDEQTSDISYARYPDGADYWRFDSSPSPGEAN